MKPCLDQIRATSGVIHAHLYENRSMGVPRGLYWSLELDCRNAATGKRIRDAQVAIEWMVFEATRFDQLSGLDLSSLRDPAGVEASIYLGRHLDLTLHTLEFGAALGTVLPLRATVELAGQAPDDADRNGGPMDIACEVRFDGISVIAESLFPKPGSAEEARALIARYFDVATLDEGVSEGSRHHFQPV